MSVARENLHRLIDALPTHTVDNAYSVLECIVDSSKRGPKVTVVEIKGCVETFLSDDEWLDQFIDWLELRGECFGGGTQDVTDTDDSAQV